MKDAYDAVGADDDLAIKRPARWPWLILLLAALGAGGYYGWQYSQAPAPLKILLAFDVDGYWWEGSTAAARMTDEVAEDLAALGFEPVRAGTPEVTEQLESAEDLLDAARQLKAAFVISGTLTPKITELPVEDGYFEIQARGEVKVQHQSDAAPQTTLPISAWSGAKKKDRALTLIGEGLATRTAPPLIRALLLHPTLEPLLQQQATGADVDVLAQLKPARDFLSARNKTLGEGEKAYAAQEKRRDAAERGPVPVTRHSHLPADDGLCGAGPEGHLVKTEPSALYYSLSGRKLYQLEGMETLEWRPDEGDAKVLWAGYNVYSYPSATPAGGYPVMLVEDLYGWAKALTAIGKDGQINRLRIDPEQRYTSPIASSSGAYATYYVRDCYKSSECPTRLAALRMADGEGVFEQDPFEGSFEGRALAGDSLLFLHRSVSAAEGAELAAPEPGSVERSGETLWRVDLSAESPKAEALWVAPTGTRTGWLSASADGQRIAFVITRPEPALVWMTLGEGEPKIIPVDGAPSAPRFSPDGRRLTFNLVKPREGDEEIFVLDLDGEAAPIQLTDNALRDRYPHFGAQGERIYFESLDRDPNFRRRYVSVISSVPSAVK